MLVNFEDITEELSDYELKTLVPALIAGFKTKTKDNPIKAPDIIKSMVAKDYSITQARLRKCVNYIRCNGLLPLIGTSKGYYCSNDTVEIEKQITSLHQRAYSINQAALGLKKFITK